jgi:hypothetical protein
MIQQKDVENVDIVHNHQENQLLRDQNHVQAMKRTSHVKSVKRYFQSID